jgi:hypothetical protein
VRQFQVKKQRKKANNNKRAAFTEALDLRESYSQGVCKQHTVTCRVVRATKMTGSSSDDWIY